MFSIVMSINQLTGNTRYGNGERKTQSHLGLPARVY